MSEKIVESKIKKHIDNINEQLVEKAKSDKTQLIRLGVDVFFIAPLFFYAGFSKSKLPFWIRFVLVVTGITTITYNGINFIKIEQMINEIKKKQKEIEEGEKNQTENK